MAAYRGHGTITRRAERVVGLFSAKGPAHIPWLAVAAVGRVIIRPLPRESPVPTAVLYVAGAGRSGSTLLDNLLGQVAGVFSAGELRYVWERGLIDERLCGCGLPLADCPVWSEVLERAFGFDAAREMAPRMVGALRRVGRVRSVPAVVRARRHPSRVLSELDDLPAQLERLYGAIADVTGASVIVDSSKQPTYGWLVDQLPNVDVRVVHLVRDSRAAAFSWLRHKPTPDRPTGGEMERRGAARSAALWNVWNVTTELLWAGEPTRRHRLRYEELTAAPAAELRRVLALVDKADVPLPGVDDDAATLAVTHTVAGNPSRLVSGRVEIRADDEWREGLGRLDRAEVTSLTAPLLLHYGYSLRV